MRKTHEDNKRDIQQSIQVAVERETSNKMNELSDKVANKVSSQLVHMNSTVIGTRKSNNKDHSKNEFKTKNDTNKTGYNKKSDTLRSKDCKKDKSKVGNPRTQDILDALPTIDLNDHHISSNHDNNQELETMVS